MKVYELINELVKFPSGANVRCSGTLTVPELENGEDFGDDDFGNNIYAVDKALDSVEKSESENGLVYLNF